MTPEEKYTKWAAAIDHADIYVSSVEGRITVWVVTRGATALPFDTAQKAFQWILGNTESNGPANERFGALGNNRNCVWDDRPPALGWFRG